jgi:hypothetical protein
VQLGVPGIFPTDQAITKYLVGKFSLAARTMKNVRCAPVPTNGAEGACLVASKMYAALRSARPAAVNPACWLQGVWIALDCYEVRESPALHEAQACWLGTWTEDCAYTSCWTVDLDRLMRSILSRPQAAARCGKCSLLVARLLDRDAPRPNTASSFLSRFTTQECPVGVALKFLLVFFGILKPHGRRRFAASGESEDFRPARVKGHPSPDY